MEDNLRTLKEIPSGDYINLGDYAEPKTPHIQMM